MKNNSLTIIKDQNLLFLILLVVFTSYSLITVGRQGFWHDEIYTLSLIKGFDIYLFGASDLNIVDNHNALWYKAMLQHDTFWTNLYRNIIHEGHPPLYYLLLKLWTYLFGISEFGLRSFSIFTSILSLFVSFKIGKLISAKKPVLFSILLGACPLFIYYSTEARSYSLYILLSLLCFFYFLKIIINLNFSERDVTRYLWGLIISATLLFYTHYYGIFYFAILSLILSILFLMKGKYRNILFLIIPELMFLPWLSIINKQTTVHIIHWTNGYLGFVPSLKQFALGCITLVTAPFKGEVSVEFWLPLLLTLALIINFMYKSRQARQKSVVTICLIILYGLGIIAFDKVLIHHTIAVPRYYIPLQFILLFCIFYMIEYGQSKIIGSIIGGFIVSIFLFLQVDFYKGTREPKQMYREAAEYISQKYNPEKVELVISPNGPSSVGIAYYLSKNFIIHSVPSSNICQLYNKKGLVIIAQHLGLDIEPWILPCKTDAINKRTVRFVGLDIINEK